MVNQVNKLTIAQEFNAKIKSENQRAKIIKIAPLLVLFALTVFFSIVEGNAFASVENIAAILDQLAIPLLIAIGLTFVIILGSIDLSIDGVVGMSGSFMALLVMNNKNANNLGFFGILIAMGACVAIGWVIGKIHVKARIPSFMVSFCFLYIAEGLAMLSYGGIPATISDPVLLIVPKMNFIGVPAITWIALAMMGVAYVIQEFTPFGRHIYAVGTAENIPRMAGVNVNKVKIIVFMFAGLCYGIAGVLGAIRLGQGQMQIGTGLMFPAQAAVVVGGTSLMGGKGGVVNSFVGCMIMTVLENGLVLMGVNPYIKTGIEGLIIIIAVALTVTRSDKEICK